jgi:cytochrome c556
VLLTASPVELGCSHREASLTPASRSENPGEVGRHATKGWEGVRSFGYDRKEEVKQGARELDATFDRRRDEIREKARAAGAEARASWNDMMNDLDQKNRVFKQSLRRLGDATREGWDEVREDVNAAARDTGDALDRAARDVQAE